MGAFVWPAEDGWPYPDPSSDVIDLDSGPDDDLLSLVGPGHVFDRLDALERTVIESRFGLHGVPVRTLKELHRELGVPHEELRAAMGSGLAKLRAELVG
jgi:hypothetical protein